MFFYGLYLVGYALCAALPRRFCHAIARRSADFYGLFAGRDRVLVRGNLAAVLGCKESEVPPAMVHEVFRNFAMYLVDFFRFSRLREKQLNGLVRFEGLDWMKEALAGGSGVIGVTAHLGNYELAAAALALRGLPVSAVVLTHQTPGVDSFFERQRSRVGVQGIPLQRMRRAAFLDACLKALAGKRVLGLVADRDYFDRGMEATLFGRQMRVPTGPASFSLRTGAPIVPCFMLRQKDGSYRFVMERPIQAPQGVPREEAVRRMTLECLEVLARYIREYPTQWYMFQEFWRSGPAVIR